MSGTGVTLVLSGGGAKTAAHVGAARALDEADCRPVRYVATSMGAVIAAALAAGVDKEALLARLPEIGRRGVARDPMGAVRGLFARALLRPLPLRRAIEAIVPARRFADLATPLTVCVTDLDSGELLLFGDGGADAPLLDVLAATCALPVYFPPQSLQGRRVADGGLRGPLPLEAAGRLARETVVAVDVAPGFDLAPAGAVARTPAMVLAHDESVGILMATVTAAHLALWRATQGLPPLVYVRPRVERHATFQVDRVQHYADDGYRAAREALSHWRSARA